MSDLYTEFAVWERLFFILYTFYVRGKIVYIY